MLIEKRAGVNDARVSAIIHLVCRGIMALPLCDANAGDVYWKYVTNSKFGLCKETCIVYLVPEINYTGTKGPSLAKFVVVGKLIRLRKMTRQQQQMCSVSISNLVVTSSVT